MYPCLRCLRLYLLLSPTHRLSVGLQEKSLFCSLHVATEVVLGVLVPMDGQEVMGQMP
jgi:hypothetical protein